MLDIEEHNQIEPNIIQRQAEPTRVEQSPTNLNIIHQSQIE